MLELTNSLPRAWRRLERRGFLKVGCLAAAGLTLADVCCAPRLVARDGR